MTAAQLTYTSELIEDYFPFVPADATGNLIVAVASDQAAIPTPSVVVANGSGVVWYRPDPESASCGTGLTPSRRPAGLRTRRRRSQAR